MTPAAGRLLEVTPRSEWTREVVATHQIARCSAISVHVNDGGRSAISAYVVLSATRTVTDAGGSTHSPFLESRRLRKVGSRWLVDARVEAG